MSEMRWIGFFLIGFMSAFGNHSEELLHQYMRHCSQPSDINEHIPKLRQLASNCSSVVEIGVRNIVSTWGILVGLAESSEHNPTYLGIDLHYPPFNELFLADELAETNGVSFNFLEANDLDVDIEPTDMLFIDSLHTYRHLTYELEKFSPKVKKYIALHDTSAPWGDQDEPFLDESMREYPSHIDRTKRGLWPAVMDFLATHPEWTLKHRYLNNHGFTILEKKESKLSVFPFDPKDLYIDLIKKSVTNMIYEDPEIDGSYDSFKRVNGFDYPLCAHTMIGMKRLDNIHDCLKDILENNVEGDCIETGVWRGGATILMRAILKAYGETTRKVWVADSFEGLPPPTPSKYPQDEGFNLCEQECLRVSLETVQSNFKKYDLLDDQVVFLKGFFEHTLPTAPIEKISLLRLDGDLYQSTMEALTALYPKVSIGGYIIIDDFGAVVPCAQAVSDYRQKHGITDRMIPIDWTGVYWKKTKSTD